MKIFISHRQNDTRLALTLSTCLEIVHGIDTVVGVIDADAGEGARAQVKGELRRCGQLLALFSPRSFGCRAARWELAMAAEMGLPFTTYSERYLLIPEYEAQSAYQGHVTDIEQYVRNISELTRRYAKR